MHFDFSIFATNESSAIKQSLQLSELVLIVIITEWVVISEVCLEKWVVLLAEVSSVEKVFEG